MFFSEIQSLEILQVDITFFGISSITVIETGGHLQCIWKHKNHSQQVLIIDHRSLVYPHTDVQHADSQSPNN